MFRFHGGQPVTKGTYWNLSSGERFDVTMLSVLPGDNSDHYLKLPAAGMFIAGPLAGLLFTCITPFLLLFVLLSILPRMTEAAEALVPDEAKACLECHATPGMAMTFKDKSTLSVYVDQSHFKNSVHGFIDCTGCHSTVKLENHPSVQYATKREFLLSLAGACKTCHADEQLMANPLHQRAINKANAPPCSDCHGSHAIRKVPTQKEKITTNQYCLTCHNKQLNLSINGQSLSLSINEAGLKQSVHGNHSCTDCHVSHSKTEHPQLKFNDIREVSIATAEACKRCHADKGDQHRGSIHFSLVSQGNHDAPVCSDCHSAHAVGKKALAETLHGVPCKKCHAEIFSSYQGSVHGMAKKNGSDDAPICSNCHFAHDVKPALASRSPKDMCFGCHEDVITAHKEWLPNAEAHFDSVACTACHVSSDKKRSVYLRVTDQSSGATLADKQVKGAMGNTIEDAGRTADNHLEPKQVWDMYQKLNSNGDKINMAGLVGLDDSKHAHNLMPKGEAIRQCEYCHTADAEYFKDVSLMTVQKDGREVRYRLDSATLGSVFAVVPLGQFYAIGSTRLWILDMMGAAMVAGGIGVPVLHGAIRVLTRNRRSRTKHGSKEKGEHL